MNENLERLLWQRTDGELTVARLLSRVRFEDEEIPAELRPRVLVQVAARQKSSVRSHVSKSRKGALATGLSALGDAIFKESFMSRKRLALLSAVAVVVVAGVAFLALSDNFPPGSGVTGAIGGVEKAERYRDAQVTASDVKVYDEDGYDQDGYDRKGLDRNGQPRPSMGDKGIVHVGGGAVGGGSVGGGAVGGGNVGGGAVGGGAVGGGAVGGGAIAPKQRP